MKTTTIIGAGNLGLSLARGLVKSGYAQANQFTVTRRRKDKLDLIRREGFNASESNAEACSHAEVIILAVLPQQINGVLQELKGNANDKLIISLVSSVTIQDIKGVLGENSNVVRAMPNTAIAIGESMTCICGPSESTEYVKELFSQVGETIVIAEDQMTSATALCACGIAFFLRSIRAASQGGIEIDFHAGEALKMAAQTAKGAAGLLLANGTHPEDEIDKVTSPKGCTIAGLNQMEHNGFSSAFIKGITTSAKMAGNLYVNDDHE